MGWFVVCRRNGLKVGAGDSKVMLLNGEEGLECEVNVDEIRLEYFSEFKYLGYVLDDSGIDRAECNRKVVSEKRIAGAFRSLPSGDGLIL